MTRRTMHRPPWQKRLADGWLEDRDGCWIWQRSLNSKGYGVIWLGRWPKPGLVVDHICNNKACVNPGHLRELTNAANIQRAHPDSLDPKVQRRREQNRLAKARQRAKSRGGWTK